MCGDKEVLVFVYGTLKKGGTLYLGLESCCKEDTITGTLYDLKAFPAVRLEGGTRVKGEVHCYPAQVLEHLDRIENRGVLYEREEIVTDGGTPCYIYEIKKEVLEKVNSTIIENGEWSCQV